MTAIPFSARNVTHGNTLSATITAMWRLLQEQNSITPVQIAIHALSIEHSRPSDKDGSDSYKRRQKVLLRKTSDESKRATRRNPGLLMYKRMAGPTLTTTALQVGRITAHRITCHQKKRRTITNRRPPLAPSSSNAVRRLEHTMLAVMDTVDHRVLRGLRLTCLPPSLTLPSFDDCTTMTQVKSTWRPIHSPVSR